jgi:hypothetical protein
VERGDRAAHAVGRFTGELTARFCFEVKLLYASSKTALHSAEADDVG